MTETDQNKFSVDSHEGKWYGQEIQSEGTPMVDRGSGKPFILRTFEFGINPQVQKQLKDKRIKPSKQDIFNYHWPHLRTLIWSDGMVANQDVEPRIVVGKKKYMIYILCEPKLRTIVADKPTTLQQVFTKKKS